MWNRIKRSFFRNLLDLNPDNIERETTFGFWRALYQDNPEKELDLNIWIAKSIKPDFKVEDFSILYQTLRISDDFHLVDKILPYIKQDEHFEANLSELLSFEYKKNKFEKGVIAKGLIERGANPNLKCIDFERKQQSFIFLALRKDDKAIIEYLLEKEAINMTPELWGACRSIEMMDKLIDAGCNKENMISYQSDGTLNNAIANNDFDIVQALIDRGANLAKYNLTNSPDNINPLVKAPTNEMFEFLLKNGAEFDSKSWNDLENEPNIEKFWIVTNETTGEIEFCESKKHTFYIHKLVDQYKKEAKILEQNHLPINLIKNLESPNQCEILPLRIQAAQSAGFNVNKIKEYQTSLAKIGLRDYSPETRRKMLEAEVIKAYIDNKAKKAAADVKENVQMATENLSEELKKNNSETGAENKVIKSQAIHGAIPKIRKEATACRPQSSTVNDCSSQKKQLEKKLDELKTQEKQQATIIEKKYHKIEQKVIAEKTQEQKALESKKELETKMIEEKLKENQEKREKLKQEQKQAEQARKSKEQAEKAKQEQKEQEEREQRAKARKEQEEREQRAKSRKEQEEREQKAERQKEKLQAVML